MEEDEASMRKAAHLMVSSLAGSLALVTCREPLRSSLATQLRHLLANSMEASQLEQTVNVSAARNESTSLCAQGLHAHLQALAPKLPAWPVGGVTADAEQCVRLPMIHLSWKPWELSFT